MEIYTYLKNDHRKVSALFTRIIKAKTDFTREKLQNEIINELLIHATTEQETFYKKLKKFVKTAHFINHAIKEHEDIKKHIKHLMKEEIGTREWLKAVRELKRTVTHHVKEEETEMFSEAKTVLTKEESKQLTIQMQSLKKQMKRKLNLTTDSPLKISHHIFKKSVRGPSVRLSH